MGLQGFTAARDLISAPSDKRPPTRSHLLARSQLTLLSPIVRAHTPTPIVRAHTPTPIVRAPTPTPIVRARGPVCAHSSII
jgi:hypothetical protein